MKIVKSLCADLLMVLSIPFFLIFLLLDSIVTFFTYGIKMLKFMLILWTGAVIFSMYGYNNIPELIANIKEIGIISFLFNSIFMFIFIIILYFIISLPLKYVKRLCESMNLEEKILNIVEVPIVWLWEKSEEWYNVCADKTICKMILLPYMIIKSLYFAISFVFTKAFFLYIGAIAIILGSIRDYYSYMEYPLVYFFKTVLDFSTPENSEHSITFWVSILALGIVTYGFVPMYKNIGTNIYNILMADKREKEKKKSQEAVNTNQSYFPETSNWVNNCSIAQRVFDIYFSDNTEYEKIIQKYGLQYGQIFASDYESYKNIKKDIEWMYKGITTGQFIAKNNLSNLQKMEKILPEIKMRASVNAKKIENGEFNRNYNQSSSQNNFASCLYIKNCKTIEELDKQYKQLCRIYHPDSINGDEETMKQINKEYEEWKKRFT